MDSELDALPTISSARRLGRGADLDPAIAEAYRSHEPAVGVQISSLLAMAGADALLGLRSALGMPSPAAALGPLRYSAVQDVMRAPNSPAYSFYNDCGPYDYNATCTSPCFGFAPEHMDNFYCATCAEQQADPVNNPAFNWHFVGSRGSIQYIDREPDVCAGKDAWKWKFGACGECHQSVVYRCHDGFKKYPDDDYWTPTICEGIVSCDDQLKTC
jgi:hypothetical protein